MDERWQLPATWRWCAARELSLVIGGSTPPTGDLSNFAENGTPWITPADLSGYDGVYISRGARSLSPEGLAACAAQILPRNSVLLSSRAPVGYCVIAAAEVTTNQGFKSFVLPPGIIPEYLRYYLLSSREYLESLASGTTFKELSGARAAEIRIPLAPLVEQRRIVEALDELMNHSRCMKQTLADLPELLEQYRASVLTAAFRGELTAEWRSACPVVESAAILLDRVQTERRRRWESAELSSLVSAGTPPTNDHWKQTYPEPAVLTTPPAQLAGLFGDLSTRGWGCCPLEGLVDATRGIPYGIVQTGYDVEGGIPTIRGGDIKNHAIVDRDLKRVAPEIAAQFSRTRLQGGEVVLAIRGSVGEAAVVDQTLCGCNISREVAMIPVLPGIDARFLAYLLTSPGGREMLATHTKGIAQRGINLADLRGLAAPIPPLLEQIEVVRRITAAFEFADAASALIHRHSVDRIALEASSFARVFRGELSQSSDDDEHADVLFARIREAMSALVLEVRGISDRRRPTTMKKKLTKELMRETIRQLPNDTFTFDELRSLVPGPYDSLQDLVFQMLDETSPVMVQKFDSLAKAMRFHRIPQ